MRTMRYGIAFECAVSGEKFKLLGLMFVDDATYFQSSETDDARDVHTKNQAAQTCLRGLTNATGGALNPSKSFWWLVDFKWHQGKWSFKKTTHLPADLVVRDKHNVPITLTRYEPNEAQRVLGVYLAPIDNGKKQAKILRQKGEDWASYARSRKINPSHAWTGLLAGIMKGISWPLAATTLTKEQCKTIMVPVHKTGLRAAGIQWKLPRKMLHGSPDVLGIGLMNIYTKMGIERLLTLVNQAHRPSINGCNFRATYQQLQLEMGLPGNLFRWKYSEWSDVPTKTWIAANWQFATESGILVDPKSPELKARREHDIFLMVYFAANGATGPQLAELKLCRLFLQVTTLADITTADGTRIMASALEGTKAKNHNPSYYKWPKQQKPPKSIWNSWRTRLAPLINGLNGKLAQPLGRWTDGGRDKWPWFYAPSEDRLYERTPDGFKFYIHQGRTDHPEAGRYSCPHLAPSLYSSAERAYVSPFRSFKRCHGSAADIPSPLPLLPQNPSKSSSQHWTSPNNTSWPTSALTKVKYSS